MVCVTKITMIYSQLNMSIMPTLILCCYSCLFIVARLATLTILYSRAVIHGMCSVVSVGV